MTAVPVFLHRSAVDCLADDLLGLLTRIEADLPPVHSAADKARVDTTKHVIDQVCGVIEAHLFKNQEKDQ